MQKPYLRSFDRSLPMALLKAREAVMKKFQPALKEQELTAQQWRVIRALESEDGLDLSELAERCYLLMPSLSRIIRALESRDLVQRQSVATDQRRSAIFLTPSGRDLYTLISPKSAERYEFITEKFGPGKLELLYELLDELIEKIDEDNQLQK